MSIYPKQPLFFRAAKKVLIGRPLTSLTPPAVLCEKFRSQAFYEFVLIARYLSPLKLSCNMSVFLLTESRRACDDGAMYACLEKNQAEEEQVRW